MAAAPVAGPAAAQLCCAPKCCDWYAHASRAAGTHLQAMLLHKAGPHGALVRHHLRWSRDVFQCRSIAQSLAKLRQPLLNSARRRSQPHLGQRHLHRCGHWQAKKVCNALPHLQAVEGMRWGESWQHLGADICASPDWGRRPQAEARSREPQSMCNWPHDISNSTLISTHIPPAESVAVGDVERLVGAGGGGGAVQHGIRQQISIAHLAHTVVGGRAAREPAATSCGQPVVTARHRCPASRAPWQPVISGCQTAAGPAACTHLKGRPISLQTEA